MEACLPRSPDGGIPGLGDKRRPSNLLPWNSLPGSAPLCGSRELASPGRAEGAGAPTATQAAPQAETGRPKVTRQPSLEPYLPAGSLRTARRQSWGSKNSFPGGPQSCSEGETEAWTGAWTCPRSLRGSWVGQALRPPPPLRTLPLLLWREPGTPQCSKKDCTPKEGAPKP